MAKNLQSHTNGADQGRNTCEKQPSKINTRWLSHKNSVFAPWFTKINTVKNGCCLGVTLYDERSCEDRTGECHIIHLNNITALLIHNSFFC
jgi:hypothetical protein